jgi:hypothetical protein
VLVVPRGDAAVQIAALLREGSLQSVFVSSTLRDMPPAVLAQTIHQQVPWMARIPFVLMTHTRKRDHGLQDLFSHTVAKPVRQGPLIALICGIADPGVMLGPAVLSNELATVNRNSSVRILVAEGVSCSFLLGVSTFDIGVRQRCEPASDRTDASSAWLRCASSC